MQRIACLFFCLLPLCAHAQAVQKDTKATTAAKKNGSTAPVATPAKAMFSDNIVAVFRAVQASGLAGAKSEFESTTQYEARLASWKGGTKKYVFVVESNGQPDDFANYTFKYDADAKEMLLTVGSKYEVSDSVQLRSIRTVLGTYVGVNAFGVKKLITRMVEETYYVKLSPSSPFHLFTWAGPSWFSWGMDPAAARANKESLRIAVVGTVPSPEATEEKSPAEPTINRPRQVLVYSRTLPFSLEELRVINSRTGATVASFPSR
jgi:hypothetical protein